MSIGHGGYARLVQADDSLALYRYCCYNINLDNWQEMKQKEDGELWIARDAFVEPEIHRRIKRRPSGRKQLQEKRIIRYVPVMELCDTGRITIRNASGTWDQHESGPDKIAIRILHIIFNRYQEIGAIPESVHLYY